MNIKGFKYSWRFTDEKYAQFAEDELSSIMNISKEQANEKWDAICDNAIIQKCAFIKQIISQSMPVFIGDCGWGDETKEAVTRIAIEKYITESKSEAVIVLYDRETGVKVPNELFIEKWTDFCYPSDTIILQFDNKSILYYEDTMYYLQ